MYSPASNIAHSLISVSKQYLESQLTGVIYVPIKGGTTWRKEYLDHTDTQVSKEVLSLPEGAYEIHSEDGTYLGVVNL